jgi:hypothetical protein
LYLKLLKLKITLILMKEQQCFWKHYQQSMEQ